MLCAVPSVACGSLGLLSQDSHVQLTPCYEPITPPTLQVEHVHENGKYDLLDVQVQLCLGLGIRQGGLCLGLGIRQGGGVFSRAASRTAHH